MCPGAAASPLVEKGCIRWSLKTFLPSGFLLVQRASSYEYALCVSEKLVRGKARLFNLMLRAKAKLSVPLDL